MIDILAQRENSYNNPMPSRGLRLLLVFGAALLTVALMFTTASGQTSLAVAMSVALTALVIGLRWPLIALFAFVAFIPIEEVVRLDGIGTISKSAGILFAAVYALPRFGRISVRSMPVAGWAYAGWAVMSIAWAVDPQLAGAELITFVQLFVIAVLVGDVVLHRPTIVRPLLWTYSLSAALVALIGIEAYATGGIANGDRVAAFQNQDVAQFAAILLPALVFAMHELINLRRILLSGAIALVCTIGIILSGTRGAWLGAAIVLVTFILPRVRPAQRAAVIVVPLLMIVIALQLPGVADLVTKRTELAVPTGGAGRTDIWTVGMKIIESSPFVGVGYGDFSSAFTPQLVQQTNVGPQSDIGVGRGPHSIIVGTLGELGVVGFLLLAALLVPLVVRPGYGPDAAAVQAALLSLLTAALFLDILNRKQFWLIVGLAAGLAFLERRDRSLQTRPMSLSEVGG
ncbi:MAG: O-antigen ligase family protein [Candidatus Limnocylindrales bacterium]